MADYEQMAGAQAAVAIADFRSDTVTRATPGMREAMAAADVGDDVYGEDPTVLRLQERVAALTGKEAALFFSSGTQSNLSAVLSQCGRGDEYLIGSGYHVFRHEAGGTSVLGGVVPFPIEVDANGSLTVDAVRQAIKADDPHYPVTRLLSLENTVSGSVQPRALIDELAGTAHELGLRVHLDGARLLNAAVATGQPVAAFLDNVDTVSLCMSKGLGAPVGSVLAGDAEVIARALRMRKILGGAMRQVGHLAAAGIYALKHNVERLADDHTNAERLAGGLRAIDPLEVTQATNMVFVTPPPEHHDRLVKHVRSQGFAISGGSPAMRLVCHLDVDSQAVDLLISAFDSYFDQPD